MMATGDDQEQVIARTPWRQVLAGYERSASLRRIRREVYGDDYADEADPSSPGLTLTELRRIARELRVGPGATIVDLGCGRGGPGLWLARETGAALVGIDIVSLAVDLATARAREFGLQERARFQLGDMAATGLPDAAFDGAISVVALLMVSDKAAAVREAARILRSGARFVFTTLEGTGLTRAGVAEVSDHRPLLEAAGFTVEVYEEIPEWRGRIREVMERIRASEAALTQELGEEAAQGWMRMAAARPGDIEKNQERTFLIAARNA
jgi:ubiquinone/menaquinone biosynthesis C-methylase UbiE